MHTTPFMGKKNHEVTKNYAEIQRESIYIKVFPYKKFKIVENALNHSKKKDFTWKRIYVSSVYTL